MRKDERKCCKRCCSVKKVKKRNGSIVDYDSSRIRNAVTKAFEAVGETRTELVSEIVDGAEKVLGNEGIFEVERIQDTIEEQLMRAHLFQVAKAFILYRKQHEELRKIGFVLSSADMVDKYLQESDWRVKENSNMNFSVQGLNNYVSAHIMSNYWLNRVYPKEVKEHHDSGDYHIHDMGMLSVYCCGWDLKDLLIKGFGGVSAKVESKAPKHFRAALGQAVNFFYTVQGEAAGAVAFSNFDTLLAPFIRHDKLSYKEVKQAMQEFIFNINVPTRVGFQTPFTNLTFDLVPSGSLAKEPVIIGGKPQNETYGEFQEEMNLLNRAFAEVMMEGDRKGRIFTFPIPTYNITKEFEWDNPEFEPIFKMTAKYGIPYFSNFINSDMNPDDARSMCCRLRLDNRELIKRGGALFGSNPLTGSIGVVTINLPRLGYLSEDEKDFFARLRKLMDSAKDSLQIKRKVLEKFTEMHLYPYSKYFLEDVQKRYGRYWANHFSTIGLVGMNECLKNLDGENMTTEKGRAMALKIMDFMREVISHYQDETGDLFNLEATPAEGTSFRLAKKDKEKYPGIIVANEAIWKRNPGIGVYYTNSTQLPVNYTHDIFKAMDLQDEIQTKYTGGTVFHIFLGESMPDTASVKRLVRKVAENYRMPYFTLSPTFSVCPEHGYLKGKVESCPTCQATCEVYSRIVGYIRPVMNWNKGKQAEFSDRLLFKMIEE